jgi:hypothetical protein
MSNPDPNKVIFSSRYKYFLDKGSVNLQFTKESQSVASSFYTLGGFSSVDDAIIGDGSVGGDFLQVKYELSTDPGVWHVAPVMPIMIDSNFKATFVESLLNVGDTTYYIVAVYFSNESLDTQVLPEVTVNISVSRFDRPLD